MNERKIIMTGNPNYGIASEFAKLSTQTHFVSRTTEPGFDLTSPIGQSSFTELASDKDVFINNSYIGHFAQVELARKVWTRWRQTRRPGLIINIGSSATDLIRPDNRLYPISKSALKDLSRRLYLHSIWEDSKIRVTYLSFGGVATVRTLEQWPHYQHLDVGFCARMIKMAVDLPNEINLDHMQLSPIQPKAKREIPRNQSGNKDPSEFLNSNF